MAHFLIRHATPHRVALTAGVIGALALITWLNVIKAFVFSLFGRAWLVNTAGFGMIGIYMALGCAGYWAWLHPGSLTEDRHGGAGRSCQPSAPRCHRRADHRLDDRVAAGDGVGFLTGLLARSRNTTFDAPACRRRRPSPPLQPADCHAPRLASQPAPITHNKRGRHKRAMSRLTPSASDPVSALAMLRAISA